MWDVKQEHIVSAEPTVYSNSIPPPNCPQMLSLHPKVIDIEKEKKEEKEKKVHLNTHGSTSTSRDCG